LSIQADGAMEESIRAVNAGERASLSISVGVVREESRKHRELTERRYSSRKFDVFVILVR
jgi:hypothetical protein